MRAAQLDPPSVTAPSWTYDLFKLGPGPLPLAVALRVAAAIGVPLVGGIAAGIVLQGVIELVLKCGQAAIVLKKNGDISITGKEISVKAAGDLVLKGRKILQN